MARHNVLDVRHRALGYQFDGDTWNDMAVPWHYNQPLFEDIVCTRTRAGLYDVSMVNLVSVRGPQAEALLDYMLCTDITKLKPGSARLGAEVDERGALVDDILVIRDGPDSFLVSHGSGRTPEYLATYSQGKRVTVAKEQTTNVLSLQGPKSKEFLAPLLSFDLSTLPYFSYAPSTLFGKKVSILRGGYSGELGYEIYCDAQDALLIWDTLLELGAPTGIIANCWNSLEATRIEAALLYYPFEMCEGDTTPWEVNMGWAVDLGKAGDHVGKAAVRHLKGRERVRQAGVICRHPGAVDAGAKLFRDGVEVGVVTTAGFSEYLMQSLAMVHLQPAHTGIGTPIEVRGKFGQCQGYVAPTPFYDPMRLRTHPEKRAR